MKFFVLALVFAVASADIVMNDGISTFPTGKTSEVMPTTKPRPHKMSFKDKLDAIDKLMKIVIENVHPNDTGFVPHEEIEKPGEKIINITLEIKKLVKKISKPVGRVAELVMKDFEECNKKLGRAFQQKLPKRAIEKQAGQCFFVIHRPFVVLLRTALDKGLFDDEEDKEHDTDKRGILRLMKHLKIIDLALGRFRDGKPDLPYVVTAVQIIKEQSQLMKEVMSAVKLMIRGYTVLGQKMVRLPKQNKVELAQVLAGRSYLSYYRRLLKIYAVLKQRRLYRPIRPSRRPGPPTSGLVRPSRSTAPPTSQEAETSDDADY